MSHNRSSEPILKSPIHIVVNSILRFRKLCVVEPVKSFSSLNSKSNEKPIKDKLNQSQEASQIERKKENAVSAIEQIIGKPRRSNQRQWRRIDTCCWLIGCLCSTWWLLLFVYNCLPADFPGLSVPETPGARLRREGLTAVHPVVLIPGIVTGGLELWEGKPCFDGLFRKRLWGGSFSEIFRRPMCWLEHLSLDNKTGLDPPGIRVRAVPGLVAADYFAPGYFVWAILIENLAKIGYEDKNMYMAAYDWRLAFQNTETRDQALSRMKSKIELMYMTSGNKKVVVVPHSMGVIYFLHFLKWVELPPPRGGGGGPDWCDKHIKAIMNIGPAFLGVPKSVANLLSSESKDVAFIRQMAPGLLDSKTLGFQTLEHVMRLSRTWDSIVSLLPKGGEAIWGDLDWSPDEEFECDPSKKKKVKSSVSENKSNNSKSRSVFQVKEQTKLGRIVSFGKPASELPSSQLSTTSIKEIGGESSSGNFSSVACGDVWTEYNELSRERIVRETENKAYTAATTIDLLRLVAPKMMERAEAHFSHGIADDLDDPKYDHYKYWSNPLETKLPNAPNMEIYCLYGVGVPTERSYVYKMSKKWDKCSSIPFQIDGSANGGSTDNGCLKGGVHFVDGDESVPVLSAGFMCAKGWRGKTRFNPSNASTYVREFKHKAPANLFEGRGLESGGHVDIMGNVGLIEDVLKVAAGANGEDLGGDRIYSDIMKMSEKINIKL